MEKGYLMDMLCYYLDTRKTIPFFKEIALDKVFFIKYLNFFFRQKIAFLLIFLYRNFFYENSNHIFFRFFLEF